MNSDVHMSNTQPKLAQLWVFSLLIESSSLNSNDQGIKPWQYEVLYIYSTKALNLSKLTCFSSMLYFCKSLCFSCSVSTRCWGFSTCFVILTSRSVIWGPRNQKIVLGIQDGLKKLHISWDKKEKVADIRTC